MVGTKLLGSELATPFGIDRDVWQFLLSLPVVLYASSIFFTGAVSALRNRTLDMMVLVAVAIGTAWLYSVAATFFIEGEVFYESAGMLATFVLLGHWFEMRARGGANDAIRALLDLAPPKAVVLRNGEPVEVPTAEVQVGDLLLIRPGSKVPVDAVVEEGESQVDESTVTGESLPVKKTAGDQLIGATINKNGTLRARATAVGSDTALAQIVKLVQEAQNSKAPGQRLADRAAFWLVLVALVGGTLTFVVWYFIVGRDVQDALLFAITVVVITCPDALGLATPTAIMVGTGLGAKRGHPVQERDGARAGGLAGHGRVRQDRHAHPRRARGRRGRDRGRHRRERACCAWSRPPRATASTRSPRRSSTPHPSAACSVPRTEAFEAVPGHGLLATRRRPPARRRQRPPAGARGHRPRRPGRPLGRAGRAGPHERAGRHRRRRPRPSSPSPTPRARPPPRPSARCASSASRPVMLSGDSQATAERVAAELGIDEVIAEVLPADKAAKVAELQAQGRKVAMVGDGVNDAPALAQADVGIAIGTGTDVAVETADVVLMRSDPLDVATAITISRGTVRKMHQNLWWAVGYNSLALPVAAGVFEPLGFVLRPEIGAISMAGSSIIVALNAVALKRLRLPDRAQRDQTPPAAGAPGGHGQAHPRGRRCVTVRSASYRTGQRRGRPTDGAASGAAHERLRPVREGPGTGQRAEEVGGALVHQAARRVVGVDGHPADRVDGQPLSSCPARCARRRTARRARERCAAAGGLCGS